MFKWLKNKVNKTLKKYFKPSKFEKGRRLFNESAKKSYIKQHIQYSYYRLFITMLATLFGDILSIQYCFDL